MFLVNDFVDFKLRQTVNVVIGLDTQGNVVDLFVKQHSEPMFLHGLGEKSMFDFVAQYQGHSVKERFIIGGKSNVGKDATYFDGVTKATVSVLVINDTIVTSALAVARAKLDGFVALAILSIRLLRPLLLANWWTRATFKSTVTQNTEAFERSGSGG